MVAASIASSSRGCGAMRHRRDDDDVAELPASILLMEKSPSSRTRRYRHYRSGDVGIVQTRLAIITDLGDHLAISPFTSWRRRARRQCRSTTMSSCGRRCPTRPSRRGRTASCRCISTAGRPGTSRSCAACTRWRCTIPRPGGWCWRATRSASSRFTMPRRRRASCSRRELIVMLAMAGAARASAPGLERPAAASSTWVRHHLRRWASGASCRARRWWSRRPVERRRSRVLAAPAALGTEDRARARRAGRRAGRQRPGASALRRTGGLFLSGGIDLMAVLAMMARLNERPVMAFTIGFSRSGELDERAQARAIATALGASHVEVEFREADFCASCRRSRQRWTTRRPTMRACRPTSSPPRRGRAAIKVILSGEGGDELFAAMAAIVA